MTLTLIHSPRTRSSSFLWLLEELEVPYDIRLVTIRRQGSEDGLDPANPHPHGKVPVILHDGVMVHEQTAISLYLTDAFPAAGMGPQIGDPKRGPYLTWLAYYSGVAEPSFMSAFLKTDVPRGTAGWVKVEEMMAHINKTLEANDYILGERFSAVDILYAGTFALFMQNPILPKSAALKEYVQRCTSRPALARATAKENG